MASSSRILAPVHTSGIVTNDLQTFTLDSERSEPPSYADSDVLPEHATETSVLLDAQAHILLRVIHGRRTIELTSLSTDVSSIRFVFPAPLIPLPAVGYDDDEIHVIACTHLGSIFRLVFPLPNLWNTQYMAKNWRQEYHLKHPATNLLGPMHVKEAGCLFLALKDGSILQLDASRRLGNAEFQGDICPR
jgi:nuclear pore complex protein Nup160